MKIITLNTWGGRAGKDIQLDFFRKYKDIDIFCLQEIWGDDYSSYENHLAGGLRINKSQVLTDGRQQITKMFDEHFSFFRPHFGDNYGLMMLVSKKYEILQEGEVFVHKHKDYVPEGDIGGHARNIQYVTLKIEDKQVTIINFHGLWNGKGKTDSEDRIVQSQKIVDFIKTLKGEVVFCGDFNLLPNTESMKIIEAAGLRNLVTEYGVQSTRTSFYKKPDKFADYILVSKGIQVEEFRVLPEEISDHAALYCEITS